MKINVFSMADIGADPNRMADMVRSGHMTPEEAICTAVSTVYGATLTGRFKTVAFRQFWEAELSNEKYKQNLLENVLPQNRDKVEGMVRAEVQQIYSDTLEISQRIREKSPVLWDAIKDSDIYWLMPMNVEIMPMYEGADPHGIVRQSERADAFHRPLNGRIHWGGADTTWSPSARELS